MPKQLHEILARLDALSVRERVLVFLTALLALGGFWYVLLIQPLAQQADRIGERIEAVGKRVESTGKTLETQMMQVAASGREMTARLDGVRRQIRALDARLETHTAQLIAPAEMARVLEGVLEKQRKLRLIRMHNLGAEPLASADDPETVLLYKHSLEMELEGTYLACLKYLNDLEALPWRFYWQVLELESEDYPTNRIRIRVGTLSLTEEWIGV